MVRLFQSLERCFCRNVLRNAWRGAWRDAVVASGETDAVPAAGVDAVLALERSEQIALAMAALPDRYRAVLRAKYEQDLTVVEIAERTLQTPKAVESLLTRARDAFRRAYRSMEDRHGS